MTYRELLAELRTLAEHQLDKEVTVELSVDGEIYPTELRIAGEDHPKVWEDMPIIYAKQ